MNANQKGPGVPGPTLSPAELRQALSEATAPHAAAPQAAPALQPTVPQPMPPRERVMSVRRASNDAYADSFLQNVLEFVENCPAELDDAYAIIDTVTAGADERLHYAFQAHLVMNIIRTKKLLPELLQRVLTEVGARLPTLTDEQQADVMFSIFRELLSKR